MNTTQSFRSSLTYLVVFRHNPALREEELCVGLDLVRCESLQSLDQHTVSRLLRRNYSLLLSMAPLSHNLRQASTSNANFYLSQFYIWIRMNLHSIRPLDRGIQN